jgi:hypothetical protein
MLVKLMLAVAAVGLQYQLPCRPAHACWLEAHKANVPPTAHLPFEVLVLLALPGVALPAGEYGL